MATHFVTMTDRFMSGWGMARGMANKLVISCDSYSEAAVVADNARQRSEMHYVNIRASKPYYPNAHVSRHGRDEGDYGSWFVDGYFAA